MPLYNSNDSTIQMLGYLFDIDRFVFVLNKYDVAIISIYNATLYVISISWILGFWSGILLLIYDLFWIRFTIKRQNKALTQQQVEAFD